jgi:hypothetical protein
MKEKKPKKRMIKIVYAGSYWIDISNNIAFSDADKLIDHVNTWNIVVENEDCFTRSNEFWYKKGE